MVAVVVRVGSYAHTTYLVAVFVFNNYPKKTVPPLGGGGGEIPPKILCKQLKEVTEREVNMQRFAIISQKTQSGQKNN